MRHEVLALVALIAGSTVALADGPVARADRPVPDQFIVVFKDGVARGPADSRTDLPSVAQVAQALAGRHAGAVRRSFEHGLKGAVVRMSMDQAEELAHDPSVALVEQDGIVELQGTQVDPPSWGLDRLDQRQFPLDSQYSYNNTGAGVDVYVIDSGIRSTHQEFGGRVDTTNAFTAIVDGHGTEDCNGHGTIVAGIIGGSTFGVAKGVRLHPVRVVGCDGTGTVSDVVAGLDWVTAQHTPPPPTKGKRGGTPLPLPPAVANISLSSPGSGAIDQAVQSAVAVGIAVVAAAGNNSGDACNYSPSRVYSAITVGASNDADNVWTYSNGGPCVDLFAPGVSIPAPFIRADDDSIWMTGTSAAAPSATGVAALYLGASPEATPQEVATMMIVDATPDVLALVPPQTQNRMLFSGLAGVDRAPAASFVYSCRGTRCSFDASSSTDDHGLVSYDWDFGDGSSGSGEQVTHRFGTGTAFLVTLTVTDTAGQTATATQSVIF